MLLLLLLLGIIIVVGLLVVIAVAVVVVMTMVVTVMREPPHKLLCEPGGRRGRSVRWEERLVRVDAHVGRGDYYAGGCAS